jgi:AraC family transcriptional regulator
MAQIFAPITFGSTRSIAEGRGFRLLETAHRGNTRLAAHEHEDVSLDVVVFGVVEECVGRRVFCRRRGSLLIKPAGALHANRYGPSDTRGLLLQLPVTSALLSEHRGSLGGDARHIDDVSDSLPVVAGALFRLRELAAAQAIEDAVRVLLSELTPPHRRRPSARDAECVARAARGMILDGADRVSLTALANSHGLTPSAVTHAFRRLYSCTPRALQRRTRLERAEQLLGDPSLTLSQVAARSGFSDQAHFSREFRRIADMTPGTYRRLHC